MMKKRMLSVLLALALMLGLLPVTVFAAGDVAVNETNFPDAAFRNYISQEIDGNGDGKLGKEDIQFATHVRAQYMGITSLQGIEYLTELTYLRCNDNQITQLDVSKNTKLKEININNNRLTTIDVSKNTALEELACNNNYLTSVDVSRNKALKYLYASDNDYTIYVEKDLTFDLNSLPEGFDISKAGGWRFGAVKGSVLTTEGEDWVYYDYDCGRGFTETFTLLVEEKPEDQTDYTLVLQGGKVYKNEAGGALITDAGITGTGSGGKYTYTFRDVEFATTAATAMEVLDQEATIHLPGGSASIIAGGSNGNGDAYGLLAAGDLTVTGSGALEVQAGDAVGDNDASYGIGAEGDLIIRGGLVTGIGGRSVTGSVGVTGTRHIIVEEGQLCGIGGPADITSVGIGTGGDVTISGGTVAAGADTAMVACGLVGWNVTVTGGTLELDGRNGQIGYAIACGNQSDNAIVITGGTVELAGSTGVSGVVTDTGFADSAIITRSAGGRNTMEVWAGTSLGNLSIVTGWKGDGTDAVAGYTCMVLKPRPQAAPGLGDVDGNGTVEIYDALMALYYINGRSTLSDREFTAADVVPNGEVDVWDVLQMIYYINGRIDSF